jgi:hypothetical protein
MIVEDLAAFASTDDFGVSARWKGATVNGQFSAAYSSPLDAVASVAPNFLCAAADVDGVAFGDAIEVNDARYTVREIQLDELGAMVLLVLERV